MSDLLLSHLKLPDELRSRMQEVYDIPSADLLAHAEAIIQDNLDPLRSFLNSLPPDGNEIALVLRAILLLYTVTAGAKVPHQMQLESLLPVMANLNSLVNTGTGSVRTFLFILYLILLLSYLIILFGYIRD